jgi:exosortase/archaeosortase family protein
MKPSSNNASQPHSSPGPGRFVVFFFIYLAVGSVLIGFWPVKDYLVQPWTRVNVILSAALSQMIGIDVVSAGTNLRVPGMTLNVLDGCNGVFALLIFSSAVLAFPAKLSYRALGVSLGALLILGANLIRLVNLVYVARYYPDSLEFFHVFVWQTLIIVIAFLMFLGWSLTLGGKAQGSAA